VRGHVQIWFFSGILLLTYGVLIAGTGLWELSYPLANPPVLYELHPPIWWGAIMAVAGLIYVLRFRPR
jgi:hypothetical protein